METPNELPKRITEEDLARLKIRPVLFGKKDSRNGKLFWYMGHWYRKNNNGNNFDAIPDINKLPKRITEEDLDRLKISPILFGEDDPRNGHLVEHREHWYRKSKEDNSFDLLSTVIPLADYRYRNPPREL